MNTERKVGFVAVNGVSTQISTWGGWIEDNCKNNKEVVIFFPGNPGIIAYYNTFLTKLHSLLNIPVWAVSFAGHAIPPPGDKPGLPSLAENQKLYSLRGQIDHKIDFIKIYVPEKVSVIIVAHSIGAKLAVEVLKDSSVRRKIKKAYLLFPVIERLLETPNANSLWVRYPLAFFTVMVLLLSLFNCLPLRIREAVISFFLKRRNAPSHLLPPTLEYTNTTVFKNVAFLGLDEIKKVRELDGRAMKEFSSVLFLYYGERDGWVPLKYWKEMTENHPEVQCMVCKNGIKHSFSKTTGEKMAEILTDLIKRHKENQIIMSRM